jgi:hypothetical protein
MTAAVSPKREWFWVRFWHDPVRAERLACMRILLAVSLLTEELFQYLPNLAEFFGPEGQAPAGLQLHRGEQLGSWRWTYAFFNTDNLAVIYPVFWLWVAVTILFLIGWRTRWMNLAVWFLTRCFIERNPDLGTGADDTVQLGLFLLLFSPSGQALSLDARRLRRKGLLIGPAWTPAWPVRLIQIQVCLIYCTTGLIKLKGDGWMQGTWWDGSSVYYLFNATTLSRWSFAQLPLPFWMTMLMTYSSVWFETLFPLLMLHRWTRRAALVFGILFHLGIYLTVEVGWFGFHTLSFYGVWTPDRFWSRFDQPATTALPET